jgi:hypothetical protein
MTYKELKEISLSIINDISFEEFQILCSSFEYTEDYVLKIWQQYSNKPLEFVISHDTGEEIFNYLNTSKEVIK